MREGVPVLKQLIRAESVDVVTRAGAGGMILTEAARADTQGVTDVTLQEAQELVNKATAPLLERNRRSDAREEARAILRTSNFKEATRESIIDTVLSRDLPLKEGALDLDKFREAVTAESKRMATVIAEETGLGTVRGMGPSGAAVETDPVKIAEAEKRERKARKRFEESEENTFARLTGLPVKGKAA